MIPHPRPLIDVLEEIPDFRKARGKRYGLASILALACCAMLCGYRSYSAMAEWGRHYGARLAQALGFERSTPCAATLHTIFRHLDLAAFEATLSQWAESVVKHTEGASETRHRAVAIDGKTLRGSKKQGAAGAHLLSALAHDLGLTLAQEAVDDKTNEIGAVATLLERLVLSDRVITMDALLTQRSVAHHIVGSGGDYVMLAKDNQPSLRADIELVFASPPWGDMQETAQSFDIGHGRIEQRTITTSSAPGSYSGWAGSSQVFKIERCTMLSKKATERLEVVYGITSLSRQRATPAELLHLVRGQWRIENQSHWVRDVTFDEDRSQVRCGSIAQVMAALRNTAIGLLRQAGYTNIARACRKMAARPKLALALIGIEMEN